MTTRTMKSKFSEYYQLTDTEFDELWKNALFVFDANVLLDLYRLSRKTSDTLIKILEKVKEKNQLWMPYQIGFEFHKDRRDVIETELNEYKRLSAYFSEKFLSDSKEAFNQYCNSHPLIKSEKYTDQIEMLGKKISKSIKRLEEKHPNYTKNDPIMDKVTELYSDCVGDAFTEEELKEIFREGAERYTRKTPPGYMDDKNKKEPDKYGDLVIWKQLINKSKTDQKPIIFVTRDTKEDWWHIYNGEKNGARKELVKEMNSKASTKFYIYEITNFISMASQKFSVHLSQMSSAEFKELKLPVIDISNFRVAEGISNMTVANISDLSAGTVSSNAPSSLGTASLNVKSTDKIK